MEILIFLYMTTAVVGIISYITQFHKLIIDKTNSASVSILSWLLWSYAAAVSLLYALFVNGDTLLIFTTGLGFVGSAAVLSLVIFNRYIKEQFLNAKGYSIADILKAKHHTGTDTVEMDTVTI